MPTLHNITDTAGLIHRLGSSCKPMTSRRHQSRAGGKCRTGVAVVDPIDQPGWDQRLLNDPRATVFHSAGWAATLTSTYGFRPFYVTTNPNGPGTGLLPLMEAFSLRAARRGISLPFTDSCSLLSPAGSAPIPLEEVAAHANEGIANTGSRLIQAAREVALERGWRTIEFRPEARPEQNGPDSVRFLAHTVALVPSDTEQRALCRPATRRTLRQAQDGPLDVKVGVGIDDTRAYYRLHCLTRQRHGAPPQPFALFLNIHRHLIARDLGYIVLASNAGEPIAGAVFLRFGNHAVYKFGASDMSRQHLRPNQLVMWTGLRHAARLGCTDLDMGRTSINNAGLLQFKRGWGAAEFSLSYHCFDLKTGALAPLEDRTGGRQAALIRRFPLWVNRWIGNLFYQYAA